MDSDQTNQPSKPSADDKIRQGRIVGMPRVLVISMVCAAIVLVAAWAFYS